MAMSRGLRNRNPGNIRRGPARYKGETAGSDMSFKSFVSMEWGYRAIFVLLHTYAKRYGLRTIRGMISRYAPPGENATEDYIRAVERISGINADTAVDTLNPDDMIPIVKAISRVENGKDAATEPLHRGWELFHADFGN